MQRSRVRLPSAPLILSPSPIMTADAPPISGSAPPAARAAYIHVPFCRHRCGYCNFTLVAGRDDLFDDYARALEMELKGLGRPHQVDSLFFGGGTPTQLTPALLQRVIETATHWFPLAPGYEFTVEANPG